MVNKKKIQENLKTFQFFMGRLHKTGDLVGNLPKNGIDMQGVTYKAAKAAAYQQNAPDRRRIQTRR
jgi:hypothetical protein